MANFGDIAGNEAIGNLADTESWTTFTPVWSQGVSLTWVNDGSTGYCVINNICFFQVGGYFTSAGTAANKLVMAVTGLPTRATSSFYARNGSFHYYDSSGNLRYIGMIEPDSSTSGWIFPVHQGSNGVFGTDPAITVSATGDQAAVSGFYLVA